MGSPSSDFNALYQQRLLDSTNGQPAILHAGDLYRDIESIMQTPTDPLPPPLPPPLQLLPKDLLRALRTDANPKEAAQREVETFIEQATGRNRTPLPPQFQTASFFTSVSFNSLLLRKF